MAEQLETESPRSSSVELSDCIETLLYFTLDTYISEIPDFSLSREYCSRLLLQDELSLPNLDFPMNDRGVPMYPLYKRLATNILECIVSQAYSRTPESNTCISVSDSFKEKEKEWDRVIVSKGSDLMNMLKSVEFELHVQEPYFSQLLSTQKTVEGRCCVGNYTRISPCSLLLFNKCLILKVENVTKYPSFSDMLKYEGLSKVLPGVATIEEGVQVYRGFYSEEKELSNGVIAISVSKPSFQPYICLAEMLSELGYEGIGGLLGMVSTIGTVSDALPPPRSSLLSSSMKLLHPDTPEKMISHLK